MRKIVIILSVLVLIASGCGQATKKQTETVNETIIEQNDEKNEIVVEKNSDEKIYLRSAEDFLKQLMNGEKLQLFFSDNWTFIYHEDNRCDGSTDGEKRNLSPFEIDEIIKLKVKNNGNGWDCDKKEPTEFYLNFNLKGQVKKWDRFEMPNYENQGKDGIIHIVGGGESDYIVLHYNEYNLIVKMEYRSEDPG